MGSSLHAVSHRLCQFSNRPLTAYCVHGTHKAMDAELVRYITEKCRKDGISSDKLLAMEVTPEGVKGGVPWAKLMPKDEMQLQAHVALRACMASRSKEVFLKVRHAILHVGDGSCLECLTAIHASGNGRALRGALFAQHLHQGHAAFHDGRVGSQHAPRLVPGSTFCDRKPTCPLFLVALFRCVKKDDGTASRGRSSLSALFSSARYCPCSAM